MAHDERSAYGPWTDYSRQLSGAEDAVGAIIEAILMDGGTVLWQKYLERKAFAFAAGAVTEAVVSQLTMCFVAHDKGEDMVGDEDWDLEDEPEPGEVDSWARMHLPVRRLVREDSSSAASANKANRLAEKQRLQKRAQEAKNKSKANKAEKSEPRAAPILEETALDEEEERLRDQKFQEEARRRDKERKAKEAEKQKDEERKTVIALHEEMSRKAHTFDTDGKIIWVEEIKVDKLPKVTETFPYNIKKNEPADPRTLRTESGSTTNRNGMNAPEDDAAANAQKKERRTHRMPRGTRKSKVDEGDLEFTDGFSKLQHGQPPILDTMNVQPGVVLESMGKKKAGGGMDLGNPRQMSRKEYVMLAQQEVMDMHFQDGGGSQKQSMDAHDANEGPSKGDATESRHTGYSASKEHPGGPGAGSSSQEAVNAPGGSSSHLPPLQPSGSHQRSGAIASHQSASAGNLREQNAAPSSGAPVQMAPPVRTFSSRGKRFEAVGHLGRPPRYHTPLLGGPSGFSAPQPPLGATMGHGLIRNGSLKESYFFPVQSAELPGGMLRSVSEASLPSTRRAAEAGRRKRSSKPTSVEASQQSAEKGVGAEQDEEDMGGRLKPEVSMAYRNFRSALVPNEPMRM